MKRILSLSVSKLKQMLLNASDDTLQKKEISEEDEAEQIIAGIECMLV